MHRVRSITWPAARTRAGRNLKGRTTVAKRTTSDSTPEQPRYLLLTEERTNDSYLGRYFKMTARVVTDKYEHGQRLAWGVDDGYGDGLLYSGLRAGCQGDDNSALRDVEPVYGYRDVEYHDVYSVDARKARRMLKTLETVERKLTKLGETRGYCRSWGEYVGRLAEALGCAGIVVDRGAAREQTHGYRYDWQSIGDGINAANNAVWRWQRDTKERLQPAAREEAAS
jgi:hypothetical protein